MDLRQIIQEEIKRILEAVNKPKKLRVFDLDNTLITSSSFTYVKNKRTGETKKLTPAEFAVYKPDKDDIFDFSEFNKIMNGKPIKRQFDIFAKMVSMPGTYKTVILTARHPNAIKSIQSFLKKYGVTGVEIIALGSNSPQAKADWIRNQIEKEDFNDVMFVDDSVGNINAVKKLAKEMPDIKFTIRLAKM